MVGKHNLANGCFSSGKVYSPKSEHCPKGLFCHLGVTNQGDIPCVFRAKHFWFCPETLF
ncbi:MAG: hypothetical protein J6I34_06070 [Prevotella sp.]|nr:hypothetical protein [Prevotella sp.]